MLSGGEGSLPEVKNYIELLCGEDEGVKGAITFEAEDAKFNVLETGIG